MRGECELGKRGMKECDERKRERGKREVKECVGSERDSEARDGLRGFG